jgi:hypothetical protein
MNKAFRNTCRIADSEEMKKMKEKMQGYQDMYLTGSREIYQVW